MNHPVIPDNEKYLPCTPPTPCGQCGGYPIVGKCNNSWTLTHSHNDEMIVWFAKDTDINEIYEKWEDWVNRDFNKNYKEPEKQEAVDSVAQTSLVDAWNRALQRREASDFSDFPSPYDFIYKKSPKSSLKPKSHLNWRRILIFTIIYCGYSTLYILSAKFYPFISRVLFSISTYLAISYLMGVKIGDYFWETKE